MIDREYSVSDLMRMRRAAYIIHMIFVTGDEGPSSRDLAESEQRTNNAMKNYIQAGISPEEVEKYSEQAIIERKKWCVDHGYEPDGRRKPKS